MLDENVGYIALNQFTEGCSQDVRRAFIELRQQGMKGFVFDLRNNGGGSLQEAIKIVNMFVPKGITLVTTKGKMKKVNHSYKTDAQPIDTVMPVVVMVNGNTASASEITAGSLQDLDRAVVFGTRTYGKGLVQVPMDLPHNTSMKLTTSKYYIPSGRCIQAINYKHTGGGYKEHIPDSLTHVFHTANGREVRDGGGIKPDVEFKGDTIPNIAVYLARSGLDSTEVMFNWVVDYIMKHDSIAKPEEFRLSESEWKDFSKAVVDAGRKGKTKVVGFDLNPALFPYIKNGAVGSIISQDSFGQGHDPIVLMYNHIAAGTPFPGETISCRASVADASNIDELIEA
jgi:carboxyl-terminal processing protease